MNLGADIIDIGGESSRPFSDPVSLEEELDRVIPVIEEIRNHTDIPVSIDTTKSKVALEAVRAGADVVNDISSLRFDKDMGHTIASLGVPVVLMHMRGIPKDMQSDLVYENLIEEIKEFFLERISYAASCGIMKEQIILDPGIGFGKSFAHNLEILNRIKEFTLFGRPVLIGTSRKAFIGNIIDIEETEQRDIGTAATLSIGVYNGAQIVRVHNVKAARQTVSIIDAIKRQATEYK